ncbi:amino acid ABC transporter permease [Puniceicoccaceae bacterium K14]|nr:amino acid ABC transporter permease [Puniceicoccaceae bacterium K14]
MSFFFEDSPSSPSSPKQAKHFVSFGCAFLFLSFFVFLAFTAIDYNWNWSSVFQYKKKFIDGWLISVGISFVTLFFSLIVGFLAAMGKRSTLLPIKYVASIYIELVRGTPLLVQIYLFYYVIADAAGVDNRYVMGVVIMSLFSGAYIAEIFRAGIESVGKSQLLSAKAIGLSSKQTYRFVIIPQALRNSLPALAGQFANLIKDSSLLSTIAIREFTLNAQEVNSITYSSFESYFPLAIGYLAITLPVMQLSRVIENKIRFET